MGENGILKWRPGSWSSIALENLFSANVSFRDCKAVEKQLLRRLRNTRIILNPYLVYRPLRWFRMPNVFLDQPSEQSLVAILNH